MPAARASAPAGRRRTSAWSSHMPCGAPSVVEGRACRPCPSFSETCMWPLWPGQSGDHFAMKVAISPWRWASTLVKVLNSAARSAASSAPVDLDGGLEHAGAGLGVQALEREAHVAAQRQQLAVEVGMNRGAQHRIAEKAGRDGSAGCGSPSRARECGVSSNRKNSYSAAALTAKPISVGAGEHPAQHAARADRLGAAGELAEEEQHVVFERQRRGRSPAGCAPARRDRRCASRCS